MNERRLEAAAVAPRLAGLQGRTIGLLDISKPGGSIFLDRVEYLLKERYGVARVVRTMKPTFAKPGPKDTMEVIRQTDAVIEALAD
jgi:hypothetical protein